MAQRANRRRSTGIQTQEREQTRQQTRSVQTRVDGYHSITPETERRSELSMLDFKTTTSEDKAESKIGAIKSKISQAAQRGGTQTGVSQTPGGVNISPEMSGQSEQGIRVKTKGAGQSAIGESVEVDPGTGAKTKTALIPKKWKMYIIYGLLGYIGYKLLK